MYRDFLHGMRETLTTLDYVRELRYDARLHHALGKLAVYHMSEAPKWLCFQRLG